MIMMSIQEAWSQGYGSGDTLKMSGIMCQLFLGGIPLCPASSCKEIAGTRLWDTRSGLHWLKNGVQVHCDRTISPSQSLGWMRVGYIRSIHGCPGGLGQLTAGVKKLCAKTVDVGCSSVIFSTHGISYSKVCGLVYGYQKRTPDGFNRAQNCPGCTIDDPYVDGVSITHGIPRQHIWSLAVSHNINFCRCSATGSQPELPSFVGQDYFCDVEGADTYVYADRLWDKHDCLSGGQRCCEEGQWFCKDLPQPTTDDIEFRLWIGLMKMCTLIMSISMYSEDTLQQELLNY